MTIKNGTRFFTAFNSNGHMDSRYYVKLTNKKLKNGKKIVKFTKIRGEKEKI